MTTAFPERFGNPGTQRKRSGGRRWWLAFMLAVVLSGALFGGLAAARVHAQAAEPSAALALQLTGIVVSAPDNATGIGTWRIRTGYATTSTVIALTSTTFKGIPGKGEWVQVRGTLGLGGTLLALHIGRDDYEPAQVIVRLADGVLVETIAEKHNLQFVQQLPGLDDIVLFNLIDLGSVVETVVDLLNDDESLVQWAQLNYILRAPEGDPYHVWRWGGEDAGGYINQGAFAQINLPGVHDHWQGDGVVVAVLDTGISLDHPALAGRLVDGWDWIDNDAVADEEGDGLAWGHGTHVAGIIAGVAPQSALMPVRVLDAQGRGNSFTLALALLRAIEDGADVANLSLGTPFQPLVLEAVVEWATAQGVTVVAAAGNRDETVRQYPAAFQQVLAVTAVDGENRKAEFANYSDEWVSIAAPGAGITSTVVGPLGNGYAGWSGTSMAAPFVSGATALVRQQHPTNAVPEVFTYLTNNASDLDPFNPHYEGQLGQGLLNVQESVRVAATPAARLYAPQVER